MWIVNIHIFPEAGKFSVRNSRKGNRKYEYRRKKDRSDWNWWCWWLHSRAAGEGVSACDDGCTWRQGREHPEKGLVLHSDYKGEIVAKPERVVPIQDMGQQDYIFICVKNYSLAEVCESIRDMVTDDTVIIPVMNGVDPGENIRRLVGKGTVVDSLIYTVAFANEDFSISQQDTFTWLCIGIKDADERQQKKVAEVAGILKGADIDYKDQGDIEVEIWRKYILNCAFNVMTAFYDNTIGELRRDPVKAQQYEKLVWEAASVGQAKGVALTDEHINEVIHKFRHVHADNATSSLQRDFRIRRKQTELETFSGYIVKEAKRLGVSIPLSEKIYQGLMEMAEKF